MQFYQVFLPGGQFSDNFAFFGWHEQKSGRRQNHPKSQVVFFGVLSLLLFDGSFFALLVSTVKNHRVFSQFFCQIWIRSWALQSIFISLLMTTTIHHWNWTTSIAINIVKTGTPSITVHTWCTVFKFAISSSISMILILVDPFHTFNGVSDFILSLKFDFLLNPGFSWLVELTFPHT